MNVETGELVDSKNLKTMVDIEAINNIINENVEIVEEGDSSETQSQAEAEAEEEYFCPECGAKITLEMTVCPKCGCEFEFSDDEE